jgi:hypothetical protein
MQTDILLQEKYNSFNNLLNEKDRRIVLAAEAKSLGRGGFSKVSKLSGISRVTLNSGLKELEENLDNIPLKSKSRKVGGGRKKETQKNLTKGFRKYSKPLYYGRPYETVAMDKQKFAKNRGSFGSKRP